MQAGVMLQKLFAGQNRKATVQLKAQHFKAVVSKMARQNFVSF